MASTSNVILTIRCCCVLPPMAPVESPPVSLRKLLRRVRRFSSTPEFVTPRVVALRFRSECATYGPHEIAAAVGAPAEVEGLREISYLFAHAVAPGEALELCVEQGILGFHEWAATEARR